MDLYSITIPFQGEPTSTRQEPQPLAEQDREITAPIVTPAPPAPTTAATVGSEGGQQEASSRPPTKEKKVRIEVGSGLTFLLDLCVTGHKYICIVRVVKFRSPFFGHNFCFK
jgi:hypothetical protein